MTTRTKGSQLKRKRTKKKPARIGVTVGQLTRSLQQSRHRIAILEALASQAVAMFTTAYRDEPEWAIGDGEGSVEWALEDVVFGVSNELRDLAENDKAAIRKIIGQDVAQLTPSSCPLPESEEDDDDAPGERVLDQAILNLPPVRQNQV